MKTTDPVETVVWSSSRYEGDPDPAQITCGPKTFIGCHPASADGMDGPDELASAFGKSSGGIRAASRFFGAAHYERSPAEEKADFL
ncbi:MAG: hypothetical protein ABSB15_28220, partial [Bryobacteraceae bacterium]